MAKRTAENLTKLGRKTLLTRHLRTMRTKIIESRSFLTYTSRGHATIITIPNIPRAHLKLKPMKQLESQHRRDITWLLRPHLPADKVAKLLGVTPSTVTSWRVYLRLLWLDKELPQCYNCKWLNSYCYPGNPPEFFKCRVLLLSSASKHLHHTKQIQLLEGRDHRRGWPPLRNLGAKVKGEV